jgi:hypothetical protein
MLKPSLLHTDLQYRVHVTQCARKVDHPRIVRSYFPEGFMRPSKGFWLDFAEHCEMATNPALEHPLAPLFASSIQYEPCRG